MIRFGPSGFCEEYQELKKSTLEMPEWLLNHNLDAYEISFTNGVRLSDETAEKYGEAFKKAKISVSVHAPYFINFANPNEEMIEKSIGYVVSSLEKMKYLKAKKLVFHPGALMKLSREQAFENTYKNIKKLIAVLDEKEFKDFLLCPETMGKHGQVGTIEEIAKICAIDERIIPTLDFGHINAFSLGGLKEEKDFEDVFLTLKKYLGNRFNKVHIHFSKIEYGKKGEIRHLTFDDEKFGPYFEKLVPILKKYNVEANIICESNGTQTKDACIMKKYFEA